MKATNGQLDKALSNVCELMEFFRNELDTENFIELIGNEQYRNLIVIQQTIFAEIGKRNKS